MKNCHFIRWQMANELRLSVSSKISRMYRCVELHSYLRMCISAGEYFNIFVAKVTTTVFSFHLYTLTRQNINAKRLKYFYAGFCFFLSFFFFPFSWFQMFCFTTSNMYSYIYTHRLPHHKHLLFFVFCWWAFHFGNLLFWFRLLLVGFAVVLFKKFNLLNEKRIPFLFFLNLFP